MSEAQKLVNRISAPTLSPPTVNHADDVADTPRSSSDGGRAAGLTGLSLGGTLAIVAALYRSVPGHFFYFDDFHFLSSSHPASPGEWIAPLNPLQSNVIGWYRPITTFYYFAVNRLIFGLNPSPYMTISLLTLLVNVALVFVLIRRLTSRTVVAWAGAYLYGVNFLHFETLAWAAGFQEQGFTLFALLATNAYVAWLDERSVASKRSWLSAISLVAFLLALLSKESAIILPLWLTLYAVATEVGREQWEVLLKKLLATQWPFYALFLVYLILRRSALVGRASGGDSYAVRDAGVALVHYQWFTRWILDEFLYPLQRAEEAFIPDVHLGTAAWILVGAVALMTTILAIAALLSTGLRRRASIADHSSSRAIWLGIAWFVVGLLPVSLSSGQAAYYLVFPAAGAYLALACAIHGALSWIARHSTAAAVAAGFLIFLGVTWGAFDRVATLERTGAPAFSRVAEQAIESIARASSRTCANADVYLVNFPPNVWPDRSGDDAIRLYCNGASVHVGGESEAASPIGHQRQVVLRYEHGAIITSVTP